MGNAATRCFLFVLSGARWRFVTGAAAPSTIWHPAADASVGFRDALARLESAVGQRLLAGGKLLGIDAHILISSAERPLRIALLADSAPLGRIFQEALTLVPASVVNLSASDRQASWLGHMEGAQLVVAAAGSHPEAQKVVARWGETLSRAVAGLRMMRPTASLPKLFFAGPKELANLLQAPLTHAGLEFAQLEAAWRRPAGVDLSPLGNYVLTAFEAQLHQGEVFRALEAAGVSSVVSAPWAVLAVSRFLSEHFGRSILYVDLGARDCMLVSSSQGRAWAKVWPLTGTALGAPGLARMLEAQPSDTESLGPDDVMDHLCNRAIRPWSLPVSEGSRALQERLAVQALEGLWPPGLRPDTLVLSGALRWLGNKERMLQLPASCLKGNGPALVEIVTDEPVPMAVVGALSRVDPAAALQLLKSTAGSFMGAYLRVDDGGRLLVDDREYQVSPGVRILVPVQSEVAMVKYNGSASSFEAKVAGGRYGLLVDCVGRPAPKEARA